MRSIGAALLVLVLTTTCGGSDPQGRGWIQDAEEDQAERPADGDVRVASTRLADGTGLLLAVPPGWEESTTDGLVVARDEADLAATNPPTGPRIVVDADSHLAETTRGVLPAGTTVAGANDAFEVIEEAEETTIAGHPAVSTTIRLGDIVARFVVVAHHGTAHLVTAEAPAASWPDEEPLLEQIMVASLRFAPSPDTTTPGTQPGPTGPPDTVEETTVAPTTTVARYPTPEAAILAQFSMAYQAMPSCNSGQAGAGDPCVDFRYDREGSEPDSRELIYLFRPQFGEWYWVLVSQSPAGDSVVIDVVVQDDDTLDSPF